MNIVPTWVKVFAGLIAAALLVLAFKAFCAHEQEIGAAGERAVWVAKDNKRLRDEASERARLDAQKEESDRETRRMLELAQDNRAAADRAAGQLRRDVAAYVAAAKRASAAAVGQRPPAETALDLLADLFGRADETAGELADYADRARIAGQQCERDYDALRNQKKD